ncbi:MULTISPECIES: 2OG-Fe(II) oxygenase [Bacillaceae]|jgi:prolyl 4-hydroxylase|uniref:2OG-Fe(II) oxygenase n=1 Tax=Bacillaceae TaxID=186817 RepID=UPI0013D24876|nr:MULTISPECIES: 2OG-Fe(II) oxygenase [Bacillaceae]MBG9447181.1 2OG-Fe(II) oxygenase [Cytobacillus firmus]MBG9451451.1 2OG-Fe(II) oxygenase [Cytobacillus firmus]MCS0653547.1 2OG-Fe(II) oxygenase [Cytobacillus firmus]MCU1806517.1 2OG-Fe(II) oxygenase [Cytobacillus firmus]URT69134.1 2OG-Fe(II) oxygenase [Cytobacillus firmus]
MAMDASIKEQTIFDHAGNKIITEDREIHIIAKFAEPLIVVLGNVLSDEECDQLIQQSKDRMQRSKVANSLEVDELRTSSSTFFEEGENELVARIEKRVSQIMNIPVEHGEGLQILNYKIGQEYKAHFDFFSSTSKAASNPRISTLVMYLNDVEQGGETYFPKLNLSVSPQKGMAVYFEYFYNDQNLNDLTLHGGAPVVIGDKWAATQWMRRKKL